MPKELLLSSAAAMGAVEVVSKPFEISRLVGAVDRALQQTHEEDS
jgi:DNA-binding NtrC family response regulator